MSHDISTLMRQEMDLAKAEAQQTAKHLGKGTGLLVGAADAANFVLLFLSVALWWALATAIGDGPGEPELGVAALVVALIWAVIAAVLAATGRAQLKKKQGLPRTAETVSKIPQALKGQEPS